MPSISSPGSVAHRRCFIPGCCGAGARRKPTTLVQQVRRNAPATHHLAAVRIPLLEARRCTVIDSWDFHRAWHSTLEDVYILLLTAGYFEVCRGMNFAIASRRPEIHLNLKILQDC
jgi:hypothetical protein